MTRCDLDTWTWWADTWTSSSSCWRRSIDPSSSEPQEPRSFCPVCAEYSASPDRCGRCDGETVSLLDVTRVTGRIRIPSQLSGGVSEAARLTRSVLEASVLLGGDGTHRLRMPLGAALRDDGGLVVLDQDPGGEAHRLVLLPRRGEGDPREIARFPAGGIALTQPHGIAVGAGEQLYVADAGNDRIVVVGPSIRVLDLDQELNFPRGIAADLGGRLHVADTFNNRVLRLDGPRIDLVIGIDVDLDDDGCRDAGSRPGELDEPSGIAVDGSGRIYVADTGNHRVQVFAPDGSVLLVIGKEGTGPGELSFPTSVRACTDGTFFVVDRGNARLQQFTGEGVLLAHLDMEAPGATSAASGFDVEPGGWVFVPRPEQGVVLRGRIDHPGTGVG